MTLPKKEPGSVSAQAILRFNDPPIGHQRRPYINIVRTVGPQFPSQVSEYQQAFIRKEFAFLDFHFLEIITLISQSITYSSFIDRRFGLKSLQACGLTAQQIERDL